MLRNPTLYGISHDDLEKDSLLEQVRLFIFNLCVLNEDTCMFASKVCSIKVYVYIIASCRSNPLRSKFAGQK